MNDFQCRPIDQWPGAMTVERKRSPFRSGWSDTMKLLEHELKLLDAKSVVLLMPLREQDIRLDGRPRADARPSHPGVILCFQNKHGPQRFPCDQYLDFADNIRAIALSLQALRAVDRYGVTRRGEQYKGWAALPSPAATAMTTVEAARWLTTFLVGPGKKLDLATLEQCQAALRQAEFKSHPDRGGNPDDFKRCQEARKALLG